MRLPDPQRSSAVLLGVGAYRHLPSLPGAHDGAVALREALTDPVSGSLEPERCVLLPEHIGRQEAGRAVVAAASQAEDLLLLYFAGHGELGRRSDLYLLLSDTTADDMAFSGLSYDNIRDVVLDSDARAKIVILDCCYSGSALGTAMSAATALVDEIDIEGTAVLTSAPPQATSRILDGESYPAYTGRLLALLRDGIVGGPELLTLPVLHRQLRRSLLAAGLRPPQAKLNPLLDQLGLVRNRAGTRQAPPAAGTTVADEPPPRPVQPPRPTRAPRAPVSDEPIPDDELQRLAQSPNPRDRAGAYQALLRDPGSLMNAFGPTAAPRTPPRPAASASPESSATLRRVLSFLGRPGYGAFLAFIGVAVIHDVVSDSVVEHEFGANPGYVTSGIVIVCLAAVFVALAEWRGRWRRGVLGSAGMGSFLAALGATLTFGDGVWPIVLGALLVLGCTGAIRLLRVRATRGGEAPGQPPT
ncbi:hypothetical protein FHU38_001805 [Saccharomonospora amisosensis]|uniref:Peptidase C14 caspase domain-containing protein n=1 Tax=Saccharomonospora amisosensis TaxID=1128677 RepID=A0A7X5UP08_9PSEU|nr:caspase family protein [Saccharomonospora amisosensis]NIJ11461.1 hypothetical protein [Saccharomonospora amisosensis]